MNDLARFLEHLSIESNENLNENDVLESINNDDDVCLLLNKMNLETKNDFTSETNDGFTRKSHECGCYDIGFKKDSPKMSVSCENYLKFIRILNMISKLVDYLKKNKIAYTINIDVNNSKILRIETKTRNSRFKKTLKFVVNMNNYTVDYKFDQVYYNTCRDIALNGGIKKFKGSYKGQLTDNEVKILMQYIK